MIFFCSRTEGDILPEFLELCVLAFLSCLACGGDVVSYFLRHCIFVGFRLIFAVLGHSSKLSATIFWVLCFLSDLGKVLCLNCSFSRRSFNFQELGLNGVKKHGNTALFSVTFLLPLPGDFSGNVLPSAVWICIPVLHLVNTCLSGFLFSSGFWMIRLLIFCLFLLYGVTFGFGSTFTAREIRFFSTD